MPKDTEAPSFQFYPDDFVSDGKVEAMTTEEVGAYLLLICKAWREKPAATVPDDDRVLARWARLTPDRWTECKAAVMAPWKLLKGGTRYVQPRLKKEHDKMLARRRQTHESATNAATIRWEKERAMRSACVTHANGNDSAMRNDAIPSPSPPPSSSDDDCDAIEPEIHAYFRDHQFLIYSAHAHGLIRKLVESAGWAIAKKCVDEAVSRGAVDPPAYALKVWSGTQAKQRLKAGKSTPAPMRQEL